MSKFRQENDRKDRMYNIAVAILEIAESGKEGARTRTLRDYIRRNLAMPQLDGEARFGDLRAHGDAVGGHGLRLDVARQQVKGKTERVIKFTKSNLKRCEEYLQNLPDDVCNIF